MGTLCGNIDVCSATAQRVRRHASGFTRGTLADYNAAPRHRPRGAMSTKTTEKPRIKTATKTQRPPLWKVILLNDDYTPREFVVEVLKAVFRMNESQAYRVMMTAHQRGACVIAVYTRDVAETKAKEATEMGKSKGYPLYFTTEKEE
jgi:ATP-dependent Clp protease adaptor protein ClpS